MAAVRVPLLERLRGVLVCDAGRRRISLRPPLLERGGAGRRSERVRRAHVRTQGVGTVLLYRREPADHLSAGLGGLCSSPGPARSTSTTSTATALEVRSQSWE